MKRYNIECTTYKQVKGEKKIWCNIIKPFKADNIKLRKNKERNYASKLIINLTWETK